MAGGDCITVDLIKGGGGELVFEKIVTPCNHSLKASDEPVSRKSNNIFLLKGVVIDLKNSRATSLSSVRHKLFTEVVSNRINYLTSTDLESKLASRRSTPQ